MRVPRDVSGRTLVKALGSLGYEVTNQTGSHMRVTTQLDGEHHVTVPDHDSIKIGTLNKILRSVAEHHSMTKQQLISKLFG